MPEIRRRSLNPFSVFVRGGGSASAVPGGTEGAQGKSTAGDVHLVANPVIFPASGTITDADLISITDGTAGATIRYTIDGSTPDPSSTAYTAPFTLPVSDGVSVDTTKWIGAWNFNTEVSPGVTANLITGASGSSLLAGNAGISQTNRGYLGTPCNGYAQFTSQAPFSPAAGASTWNPGDGFTIAGWWQYDYGPHGTFPLYLGSAEGLYIDFGTRDAGAAPYSVDGVLQYDNTYGQYCWPWNDTSPHFWAVSATPSGANLIMKKYVDGELIHTMTIPKPASPAFQSTFYLPWDGFYHTNWSFVDNFCFTREILSQPAIAKLARGFMPKADGTLGGSFSTTVKAYATKPLFGDSNVAAETYTVVPAYSVHPAVAMGAWAIWDASSQPDTNYTNVADLSGNGRNAVQFSIQTVPTQATANGRAAFSLKDLQGFTRVSAVPLGNGDNFEIWVTQRTIDPSGSYKMFIGFGATYVFDTQGFLYYNSGNQAVTVQRGETGISSIVGTTGVPTAPSGTGLHVMRMRGVAAASTSYASIDGGAEATATFIGGSAPFNLNVGSVVNNFGSFYCPEMVLGEVIVFDRALTSGEAATLSTYLRAKWGAP
jgi:hypothetical protein